MIFVRAGIFWMGSDHHYPKEKPAHRVNVESFFIDETPLTNARFGEFAAVTGHRTFAEFEPDLRGWSRRRTFPRTPTGQPHGPRSSIAGLDDHPVVHVSHHDALAHARWKGKDLPTEAEWEFTAKGGLQRSEFACGSELSPGGRHMANTWQGLFPTVNRKLDGYARTSPVKAFPTNGYDLYDMIGKVWAWTSDWFAPKHEADATKPAAYPGTLAEDLSPPAMICVSPT